MSIQQRLFDIDAEPPISAVDFTDETPAEALDAEAFERWAEGLDCEPEPPEWEPDVELYQRGGFEDYNDFPL